MWFPCAFWTRRALAVPIDHTPFSEWDGNFHAKIVVRDAANGRFANQMWSVEMWP